MHINWASGVIIDGGTANNACLDFSKGSSCIQTKSERRLEAVREKVLTYTRRAATAMKCEYRVVDR